MPVQDGAGKTFTNSNGNAITDPRLTARSVARDGEQVPVRRKARTGTAAQFVVNPLIVFSICAACHTVAALRAPIQDCDEVFNYWEPTHYLTHGTGFQTWEYAPKYAIRSWAYAGLHALPVALLQLLWRSASSPTLFTFLRILLGLLCATCETRFFSAISKTLNERVALFFLFIMCTSPGLYHASIAYLPSSFAMYAAMLGASYFMDWTSKRGTVAGILCFGIGAILGWPFAAALILPYLMEELIMAIRGTKTVRQALVKHWSLGVAMCLLFLVVQTAIDSAAYRKLVVVPLNIVLYNVFSSKGPDLYGTEPWHFYLRNLALNFHVWLLLALASFPLLLLEPYIRPASKRTSTRPIFLLAPMYLWLVIFTLQPHKEERFMYPAYPFLALNAAWSFHFLLAVLGDTGRQSLVSRIPVMVRLAVIFLFILAATLISVSRVLATWSAFAAPLSIYQPLFNVQQPGTVCLGKEWYRFPSHYLLPDHFQARFIRSEFRGLLPGHFTTVTSAFPFSATWTEPVGMNDDNLEDLGKYTPLSSCDYLVDSHLPSTALSSSEPNFIDDVAHWEKVRCMPFLDSTNTGTLARMLWLPESRLLPSQMRRVWGDYCLLKRVAIE